MSERTPAPKAAERPSSALKAAVVGLVLLDMLLTTAAQFAGGVVGLPELIGVAASPVILTILAIGIARLFRKAKTQRGAAKVAVGTLATLGVLSLIGLLSAVTHIGGSGTAGGGTESADRIASVSAAAMAKSLPREVDSVTQLRALTASGDTLVYEYQLSNVTAADLDPSGVEAFRTQLIDHACGNATNRRQLLSKGVVMRHKYVDAADATLTSVDISEAVCSKAQ